MVIDATRAPEEDDHFLEGIWQTKEDIRIAKGKG